MASVRRTTSVRAYGNGAQPTAAIQDHEWFFRRSDLHAMHTPHGNSKHQGYYSYFAEMGGARGLAHALRSNCETGLLADEVNDGHFSQRLRMYGSNHYPKAELKTFWEHCKEGLEDEILQVLLVAGLISLIIGAIEDPHEGWFEGLAIWVACALVTFVGAFNNYRQERLFQELEKEKEPPKSLVIRNGIATTIENTEIVVGDVVELSAGNLIAADGIWIGDPSNKPLIVDEAALTGESLPVNHNFSDPFLTAGTAVVEGEAHMLVTAVGTDTLNGQIMLSLVHESGSTPLQEKLEGAALTIGYFGFGTAAVLFLINMGFWLYDVFALGYDAGDHAIEIIDYFILAITIVVVAVPEGLPLAVNVSLAYSMKKMMADKIMVKVLAACETMGNATAICSDKTGTLTQNIMTVERLRIGNKAYDTLPQKGDFSAPIMKLLNEGIACNSKVEPTTRDNGPPERWVWALNGSTQTEVGMVSFLIRHDVDLNAERAKIQIVDNTPFSSSKKYSAILIQKPDGGYRRYFKGAGDRVVNMCSQAVDEKDGSVVPLDAKAAKDYVLGLSADAIRVLAFCYKDYEDIEKDPETGKLKETPIPHDAVLIGVMGIRDPLRPETRHSVRTCQRAGIIVRMVTGDSLPTAKKIAEDCGILTDPSTQIAMEGNDFEKLFKSDPTEFAKIIPNLRVLARSLPAQKKILVDWLITNEGQVVGATGDGTNDAPALKAASVGLAMASGTDVAKMAADTVILDDKFSSVVRSVMWGRSVYDNIAKFVQFQLTVNIVALTLTVIGAITGLVPPLTAVQLLWVNLIMDTMAALALGTEKPLPALLARYPYSPEAGLIQPVMWRNLLSQSVLQLVVLCVMMYTPSFFFSNIGDGEDQYPPNELYHNTLIFNAFVFLQVFNEINSRKVGDEIDVFGGFFDNSIFSIILLITLVLQIVIVEFGGGFTTTTHLSFTDWLITIAIGIIGLPFGYGVRMFIRSCINFDAGRVHIDRDVSFPNANLDQHEPGELDFLDVSKTEAA
jgi:Ca2+-transporting ATPase